MQGDQDGVCYVQLELGVRRGDYESSWREHPRGMHQGVTWMNVSKANTPSATCSGFHPGYLACIRSSTSDGLGGSPGATRTTFCSEITFQR